MRDVESGARALIVALAAALLAWPPCVEAVKAGPTVAVRFDRNPATAPPGAPILLELRLAALAEAPDVIVELLPSPGVRVVGGVTRWVMALARGQEMQLPLAIELDAASVHTLGARVTVRRGGGVEVSGDSVTVGGDGSADADPPDVTLRPAGAAGSGPARSSALAGGMATVTGRIQWLDPEGLAHPVRRASVEILEAASRSVLARTGTDDDGTYAVTVAAVAVSVAVYAQDADGKRIEVTTPDEPSRRHAMESAALPLVDSPTVIDLTSAPTARGTPGAPSKDSLAARAFAVFDGLLTFWMQAAALTGHDLERVRVVFPASTIGGCGTTCYVPATLEIFVLREDAFDWDVLGHEFFHFVADRAAPRVIDENPGGGHGGGSAIGQPPRPGATARTRDEGMRLAWSEGLATFMSLALQAQPPDPTFDFPRSLTAVGDRRYRDSEDVEVALDPEAPADSAGFGSPSSVLGLLWDLFDAAVDAAGLETVQGVGPRLVWSLITRDLPCDPCDRIDRVWTAATMLLGPRDGRTLAVARLLALNGIAPLATAPAAGSVASAARPPAFSWSPNGDPSPDHRTDRFLLAFSRDGFAGHVVVIGVPVVGATSYTPTAAEWAALIEGAPVNADFDWLVLGARRDDPAVPEGWYWYSNVLRFRVAD